MQNQEQDNNMELQRTRQPRHFLAFYESNKPNLLHYSVKSFVAYYVLSVSFPAECTKEGWSLIMHQSSWEMFGIRPRTHHLMFDH